MKSEISQNRTFLMGLAMIAVVLFHHGWVVIPGITAFFYRFGLWGVDIFLFLSGFGCVYALNKYAVGKFLKRRLLRLLPTCAIVGLIVFIADLFLDVERTHTYAAVRLISLHRWYIQAIIICYALCPFAYMLLKRFRGRGLIALSLTAIVLEYFFPELDVWRIKWILGRLPVFFIGMYVAEFDLKMSKSLCIISALCLLGAVITRCRGGYYVFQWTYFLAAAMPFVCETLCRLRDFCIKIRVFRLVELLGLYSLEIYLIHEYAYWAIYEFAIPLWSKYIVFLLIVVSLCRLVRLIADTLSRRLHFNA